MSVIVEKIGRRHYLRNTPFSAKDAIKDSGCRWDPQERAWWTGKAEIAESLVKRLSSPSSPSPSASDDAPGRNGRVAARALYKGRSYYVASRVSSYGETSEVTSRDGTRTLLYFRDGSSKFWADSSQVQIVKRYQTEKTIGSLQDYAEKAKERRESGVPDSGSSEWQYTRVGEPGPVRGCGTCAQLGRMCKSCRFDEFDC